ncbi:sulfate ABC transporter substrate-binding protein [Candidatus Synechococcus calcipolaris G9]|uniref:Sulfate ABC transporter substrate-binding protein n=1 Tax=Candidatus Synechococcus calcipolaris G9 TaxID=1497997 RepID=A0ABT6EZB4_9SYNE|nr:sulfate ABC transporter substrate-binding protein [Candidatus Synechococcus calcipolaris]MDG2990922.1 sulfate ABC transporter substrate-binding protein [Candidatus Synechococcus calcipolaris G9]
MFVCLKAIYRWCALFILGLGLTGLMAACGVLSPYGGDRLPRVEVVLSSFAVTKPAYDVIIPRFAEKWQQEHQQIVRFPTSYGPSGAQARGVMDGLPADIVHLALGFDVDRIAEAGLIDPNWSAQFPNHSVVTESVPVIVTRADNPKDITQWSDLARPGVSFVTTDPKTSGAARWNVLALWASVMEAGGTPDQAETFLRQAFGNVEILSRDAREATDAFFSQGQGDALINYENEVILANLQGDDLPYTIPDVNILIENPIAVVDKNVDRHGNREVVEAFIEFLYTPEAQTEFAKVGFRPVNPEVAAEFADQFPMVKTLVTVGELGGWTQIQKEFFADGALFDQIRDRGRSL